MLLLYYGIFNVLIVSMSEYDYNSYLQYFCLRIEVHDENMRALVQMQQSDKLRFENIRALTRLITNHCTCTLVTQFNMHTGCSTVNGDHMNKIGAFLHKKKEVGSRPTWAEIQTYILYCEKIGTKTRLHLENSDIVRREKYWTKSTKSKRNHRKDI